MIKPWLSIVMCAFLFPSLDAQDPATFRAEARLVRVDVTVHDRRGEMITGLDRDAFVVYENGKPQPVTLFLRDDIPVSLGLVIDNSGSMRTRRNRVEAAAMAFVRASNPRDEVFVVNFADTPHLDVPFTSDIHLLEDGVARIDSIGGTALRDAAGMSVEYLDRQGTRDRKILLVITDGGDNSSRLTNDAVRTQAEHGGIALYAIAVPQEDHGKAARAHQELVDLTEKTGGLALFPSTLDDLEPVAIKLARQVRQQYTLGYTPSNQTLDGSYRKIRVDVKAPAKASVLNRAGYFATPKK